MFRRLVVDRMGITAMDTRRDWGMGICRLMDTILRLVLCRLVDTILRLVICRLVDTIPRLVDRVGITAVDTHGGGMALGLQMRRFLSC